MPVVETSSQPSLIIENLDSNLDWHPSFAQLLPLFMRTENTLGATASERHAPAFNPVDDYQPLDDVFGTQYEPFWASFVTARSPQEVAFKKGEIDKNSRVRTMMGQGELLPSLAAGMIAGVTDPANILVAGVPIAAKSIGKALAQATKRGAQIGAAQGAVTESILLANQPDRLLQESLLNIGLNTSLGASFLPMAFLGKRAFDKLAVENPEFLKAMDDSIREEMARGTTGGFTGQGTIYPGWSPQRASERRHAPGINNPAAPGPRRTPSDPDLGGPRTSDPKLNQRNGYDAYGFERLANVLSPQSYVINSPIRASSEAMEGLATTSQYLLKNFNNVATDVPVTESIKRWRHTLAELTSDVRHSWLAYRLELVGEQRKAKFGEATVLAGKDKARSLLGLPEEGLSVPRFREEVTSALRRGQTTGKVEHEIPQVQQIAQKIRNTIDDIGREAEEVGLLKEDQVRSNHVPRMWDQQVVMLRREELVARIIEWQKSNVPPSARDSRPRIKAQVDEILRAADGFENITPHEFESAKGIFKERTINVDDEFVNEFLVNDIDHIMRSYVRLAGADIEIVRKFGDLDMTDALEAISTEAQAASQKARKAGNLVESTAILERSEKDIKTLKAVRDVIRGVYELPSDPYSIPSRVARLLLDFNNFTMLGGATIASLTDVGRSVMMNGLEPTFRGIKPLLMDFDTWKVAAEEVKMAGTALDLELQTRALALTMTGDLPQRYTRAEKFSGYLTNAFFIANMLSPWNAFMKKAVGVSTAHRILKFAGQDGRGTLSRNNQTRLRAAFIDSDMSKRINAQFEEFGDTVDGLRIPNTEQWTDKKAQEIFRRALARDVDQTIVTPEAGDLPLMSYNIWGRILLQYKSFVAASLNRVLIPGIQMHDAQTMFGLGMMTFIGGLVTMLRDKQNGVPTADEPLEFLLDGLDQSGATSWFFVANNALEALSDNRLGFRPQMGVGPWWDTSTRWKVGSVLGPSASQGIRAGEIMSDIMSGEADWRTRKSAWRFVPGNNLFWLRMGNVLKFNELSKSMEKFPSLGISTGFGFAE